MKSRNNSMSDLHFQQLDISREDGSGVPVAKPASSLRALAAERITAAALLAICMAAAVFI